MSDIASISDLNREIVQLLKLSGYTDADPDHRYYSCQAVLDNKWTRPIYCTEIRYGNNIYGTPGKLDYLLVNDHENRRVAFALVTKFQKDKGTVDEKFPFLVENILRYPVPTIVVIEGGGYRPGAERWLRAQIRLGSKLIAVLSFEDLANWFEDGSFL